MQVALYTQDYAIQALVIKVVGAGRHECVAYSRASALLDHLQKESCRALIFDGELSGELGAVLDWAHSQHSGAFPILALASAHSDSIATLLDHRISDYLVKPVRQSELALRIRVLLQRAYPEAFSHVTAVFGDYAFDEASNKLTMKNAPLDLTQKEFSLALLFFRHLNRPLSRAFIVERIWSRDMEVSSRTIDTHVSRVRTRLGLKPENGYKLVPVYNFGYRLETLTGSTADSD